MKSVTPYTLLNNVPVIYITHKGLSAIRKIVEIAPEEAQWFHTVEPVAFQNSPRQISLMLSEKLYIPTQNTSVAQVDTTSSMMMDFYRELQGDYKDQTVVNHKLQAMTCWCHSHHNMSPNPSSQDDAQFKSFISMAEKQNQKAWQIMLIFNKQDNFYSRVYDPYSKTIHEGVSIHLVDDYDFTYILTAAKEKFKAPKRMFPSFINKTKAQQDYLWNEYELEEDLSLDLIQNIYGKTSRKRKISATSKTQKLKLFNTIYESFDDKELNILNALISNDLKKVLSFHSDDNFFQKYHFEETLSHRIKDFTNDSQLTISELKEIFQHVFVISDIPGFNECKKYIKENIK